MPKDYYAILQVPRNASQEQIERSYQRLSRLYDPQTSKKKRADQRYADIEEAYHHLGDKGRRREYDRSLLRARAAAGELTPAEALSNRFVLLGAGVIVASIVVILAALLLLGGGESQPQTPSGTPTPVPTPSPTPIPTPTGPTPSPAPSTPPEVSGEIITTESGLQYIDIREGTGAQPTTADKVQIWYTGWLQSDGTKFDSAVDRGIPAVFDVTGVIDGFTEGLLGMKEGGIRRLIIPPELGYGDQQQGSIPPGSTLIFDVELLMVIPGRTPAPTPTPTPTTGLTETPAPEES